MPIYETVIDRSNAEQIADLYARSKKLSYRMMPHVRLLPWNVEFISNQRVISIADAKIRNADRLSFPTYLVDMRKVNEIIAEAGRRGIKCGLLVKFNDGHFKITLSRTWLTENAQPSVFHRKNRAGEKPDEAWEWSNELWQPF